MKAVPLVVAVLLAGAVIHRRRQLSRAMVALATIVFVGLLAYGSGVIHPPSLELVIRDVVSALGPYT
ncbi:MAG: hypothetical protein ACR2L9_04950 [Solirubrobacteraceae bacterium]